MRFSSAVFKIVYVPFVGGCCKISLTSIANSGDKEPIMYLNRFSRNVLAVELDFDLRRPQLWLVKPKWQQHYQNPCHR